MTKKYLLHGKLTAKKERREELLDILLQASEHISTANGRKLYVIGIDEEDADSVYITEIWENKEDHDNSLKIDGVRELIMNAMPILYRFPSKGQEITILGGTGI